MNRRIVCACGWEGTEDICDIMGGIRHPCRNLWVDECTTIQIGDDTLGLSVDDFGRLSIRLENWPDYREEGLL